VVNCRKPHVRRALLQSLSQPSAWAFGNARALTAYLEVFCRRFALI
jgi:hypothetical protein